MKPLAQNGQNTTGIAKKTPWVLLGVLLGASTALGGRDIQIEFVGGFPETGQCAYRLQLYLEQHTTHEGLARVGDSIPSAWADEKPLHRPLLQELFQMSAGEVGSARWRQVAKEILLRHAEKESLGLCVLGKDCVFLSSRQHVLWVSLPYLHVSRPRRMGIRTRIDERPVHRKPPREPARKKRALGESRAPQHKPANIDLESPEVFLATRPGESRTEILAWIADYWVESVRFAIYQEVQEWFLREGGNPLADLIPHRKILAELLHTVAAEYVREELDALYLNTIAMSTRDHAQRRTWKKIEKNEKLLELAERLGWTERNVFENAWLIFNLLSGRRP